MKSIYIGICKTREDKRFKESFKEFSYSICNKYSICQMIVSNTFLADAQNRIAKAFLQSDYDYLLLLDDDHWGHTKEMLDCLIQANTYIATIHSYSRHYPYSSAVIKKVGENLYWPVDHKEGYIECEMTGFPMTLIRRDLFDKLEKPYFRATKEMDRDWTTDIDFFKRVNSVGIKPIACFQHNLSHDKITKENVNHYRNKEKFEKLNNPLLYKLYQLQGV